MPDRRRLLWWSPMERGVLGPGDDDRPVDRRKLAGDPAELGHGVAEIGDGGDHRATDLRRARSLAAASERRRMVAAPRLETSSIFNVV